jgi:hypothetical protein
MPNIVLMIFDYDLVSWCEDVLWCCQLFEVEIMHTANLKTLQTETQLKKMDNVLISLMSKLKKKNGLHISQGVTLV